MPSLRATASAVVRLSPVSMTTRMPSSRSACERLGRRRLDRVGDGDDAGGLAVDRDEDRGRAVARAAPRRCASSGAVAMPSSARNAALPSATRWPSTMPIAPLPVGESKPVTWASAMPRSCAAATIARGERMLARLLDARGEAQHLGLVEAVGRRRSRRPSACPRSACRSCRPPACRPSPCAPAPRRS